MTHVLAALGDDECAQPVLDTALALAPLFEASVIALHVRENNGRAARELARAAAVQLREVSGTPVEEIAAAAAERDLAALVLGACKPPGEAPRPRQTAVELITRVQKPVAVVPAGARSPRRLVRLLVPLEGAEENSRALDQMLALAHRQQLEIVVLHVHSPTTIPAFCDHEPHATQAWEQEFLTRHVATAHDRVSLQRRLGVPAQEIVAAAHEHDADLVILAWGQSLDAGRAQVVSEALAHSSVPLLMVPALAHGPDEPL